MGFLTGDNASRRPWLGLCLCAVCLTPATQAQSPPAAATAEPDPIAEEVALGRALAEIHRGPADAAAEGAGAAYFRELADQAARRARRALRRYEAAGHRPEARADLDAGIARLTVGDLAAARVAAGAYVGAHPADPFGQYHLGIVLFRQGHYGEAAARFEHAAEAAPTTPRPGEPLVDRFVDVSGAAAEDETPADPSRALLATPDGGGTIRGPADRPMSPNGIVGPPASRRYNLAVLNGYEYDTNVALAPAITPLGLGGLGNHRDSRYLFATFGEYRLVQRDRLVVGLIGSTYDSWQFRLRQFNVQDYMGGGYANTALGERFILGNRFEFHETLLAQQQFLRDYRLTPNLTYREGKVGHFTAFYEFESIDVNKFALTPAQVRSGSINAVGFTQAFYLMEGAGRLFLGYRFEGANTRGSDFDRHTNQVNARIEIPLPRKLVANLDVREFFDDYLNPNSLDFYGRPRYDRRTEIRVGLQKFFRPHLSSRLEYNFTTNHSSVRNLFGSGFYSYDRSVISAILIYDF